MQAFLVAFTNSVCSCADISDMGTIYLHFKC